MKVLAHFIPGETVLNMVAPEADWLDIRWCHEDDGATLHRELPWADVVWHMLRDGKDLANVVNGRQDVRLPSR